MDDAIEFDDNFELMFCSFILCARQSAVSWMGIITQRLTYLMGYSAMCLVPVADDIFAADPFDARPHLVRHLNSLRIPRELRTMWAASRKDA